MMNLENYQLMHEIQKIYIHQYNDIKRFCLTLLNNLNTFKSTRRKWFRDNRKRVTHCTFSLFVLRHENKVKSVLLDTKCFIVSLYINEHNHALI